MTTFTSGELHTDTERVLATTVREGEATILWHGGMSFGLRVLGTEPPPPQRALPDFRARMQSLSMPRISRELGVAIDRASAGE
jgi:hypothetical protein